MTEKDRRELQYWKTDGVRTKTKKTYEKYLEVLRYDDSAKSVLEIGPGPFLGILPLVSAERKVAVDPLLVEYARSEILSVPAGIELDCTTFETFESNERFDSIVSTDSLDHGNMGFWLFPKICNLLNKGGVFYLHVHLRPRQMLNGLHDHQMLEEELDGELEALPMVEVHRRIWPYDIGSDFCAALVGAWRKTQ